MQEIRVSSPLTVYHDGQFWVGMFERVEDGMLSVCRVVFGAEPSNEQLLQFVVYRFARLQFTEPVHHETPKMSGNPKRRQREVSRELKQRGPSTKAQLVLSEQRETMAKARKAETRERRDQMKQERYEQRREKRKQKHRGR